MLSGFALVCIFRLTPEKQETKMPNRYINGSNSPYTAFYTGNCYLPIPKKQKPHYEAKNAEFYLWAVRLRIFSIIEV
jgi:hypothetical protein